MENFANRYCGTSFIKPDNPFEQRFHEPSLAEIGGSEERLSKYLFGDYRQNQNFHSYGDDTSNWEG